MHGYCILININAILSLGISRMVIQNIKYILTLSLIIVLATQRL